MIALGPGFPGGAFLSVYIKPGNEEEVIANAMNNHPDQNHPGTT